MLNKTIRELAEKGKRVEYFLYADDLMIIGESIEGIKEFDNLIQRNSKLFQLKINENKTEIQYITNKREKKLLEKEEEMKKAMPKYKVTRNFTYLGQQITTKIGMGENIKRMKN